MELGMLEALFTKTIRYIYRDAGCHQMKQFPFSTVTISVNHKYKNATSSSFIKTKKVFLEA